MKIKSCQSDRFPKILSFQRNFYFGSKHRDSPRTCPFFVWKSRFSYHYHEITEIWQSQCESSCECKCWELLLQNVFLYFSSFFFFSKCRSFGKNAQQITIDVGRERFIVGGEDAEKAVYWTMANINIGDTFILNFPQDDVHSCISGFGSFSLEIR